MLCDDPRVYLEILDLPHVTFFRRDELPDVGGIYFVVESCRDCICYVGKAKSLRYRWSGEGHHRAAQMTASHRIYWFDCEDEQERALLEYEFIQGLQPPWNEAAAETIIRKLTQELEHARYSIEAREAEIKDLRRWQRAAETELFRLWAIEADLKRKG